MLFAANNMIPRIHQGFVIQNVQLKDELLSVLESNSGQDNAPLSAKRHVERLDYKKLHDVSAHDSPFSSHASAGFTNLKIRFMHNIMQNAIVNPFITI